MLRHSVAHIPPNFRGIAYLVVAELNNGLFALVPERRSENVKKLAARPRLRPLKIYDNRFNKQNCLTTIMTSNMFFFYYFNLYYSNMIIYDIIVISIRIFDCFKLKIRPILIFDMYKVRIHHILCKITIMFFKLVTHIIS